MIIIRVIEMFKSKKIEKKNENMIKLRELTEILNKKEN